MKVEKRQLVYTIDGTVEKRQLAAAAGAQAKRAAVKKAAVRKGVAATVVNALSISKEDVMVFWVDPGSGDEVATGIVPPGKQMQVNSFTGHSFRFRRGDGSLLKEYTVKKDLTQSITVTDAPVDTESESEL
jgi:hypothetical protein